jgi:hypothetical protein
LIRHRYLPSLVLIPWDVSSASVGCLVLGAQSLVLGARCPVLRTPVTCELYPVP